MTERVSIPYRKYKKFQGAPRRAFFCAVSIPYRKYKKRDQGINQEEYDPCFHPL